MDMFLWGLLKQFGEDFDDEIIFEVSLLQLM